MVKRAEPSIAVTARLSPETKRWLDSFAYKLGLTPAATITVLIATAQDREDELFGTFLKAWKHGGEAR